MKSTNKLQTCQRCHRKPEKAKRETALKLEELFEKWKKK